MTLPYFRTLGYRQTVQKLLVGETPNPVKYATKGNLLMAERLRNIPLMFYVSEEELTVIFEKMKLLGTANKSAYLRKSAIDGYVIKIDTADIKENTAQLQRIGTNINQIVKRMNQTGSLYAADVAEVKEMIKEIWLTQRSILLSQRWAKP